MNKRFIISKTTELTGIPSFNTEKPLGSTSWIVANRNIVEGAIAYGVYKRVEESKWWFSSSNSGIIQQGNDCSKRRGRGRCATNQTGSIPENYFEIVPLRGNIWYSLTFFVKYQDHEK